MVAAGRILSFLRSEPQLILRDNLPGEGFGASPANFKATAGAGWAAAPTGRSLATFDGEVLLGTPEVVHVEVELGKHPGQAHQVEDHHPYGQAV